MLSGSNGMIPPRYALTNQAARKLQVFYNRKLSPLGITAQQMVALGIIGFHENLSLGEFAKQLKVRKPTAVSMIKRLEVMGLVTREVHPQDARLNILNITDKTRKMLPNMWEKMIEIEKYIESQVGPSELRRIIDDFSNLIRTKL